MQGLLFNESNIVKGAAEHDARLAARKAEDKKKRKEAASIRKRKAGQKVKRSNKLKRHPTRPPVVRRVVKTKQVVLISDPDGPRGDIIDRDGDDLLIQWPGMDRLFRHNARFMKSVEVTDED